MSRFEEAVHFVVSITKPEELGRTKLAKALFFADLEAYRRTGKPITGAIYEKRQHGPMPRQLYEAIDRLDATGKIAKGHGQHFGYAQHQFWSREEPELKSLAGVDVAILASWTRHICENHTAASISDLSHNAAWHLADFGEHIPFAAYLAASGRGEATPDEIALIEAALGA